ncbi:MAG: efflux RND transporter permease subunit [Desulfarculus sp.]|nr:efflux RND transporter permease subunit [Desulfarculus sp.]
MSPTELFIRRPVATTLISLGMLLFGVLGYLQLPTSDLPNVDYPTITVSASLPGASPETMATAVAMPLEREFTDISGLASMSSSSTMGSTSITLQFDLSRNIDAAAQDVQAAMSKAVLPSNMPSPPTYSKTNASAQPVFYLAIGSETVPLYTVNDYAQTLVARRISMLNGVGQVLLYGEQKYSPRVQLNPQTLASLGIGMDQVADAITQENVDLPLGNLDGPYKSLTLQATGQLMTAREYRPIIVSYQNGKPVRLEDLGQVIDSVQLNKSGAWWKGHRAIVLAIKRQPGANTIDVVDQIRKMLPEIQKQLPGSINLVVLYDQSTSIRESVTDVKFTLLLAIALVILVVFLFLKNASATIITSLAVPMSLITTFSVMWALDFSLDNLSLMALTLSVGFVVDDAIVVLENIVRHMEMGKKPFRAALDGAQEIGFTIISMTLSLAVVFLPVVFMAGMIGRLLKEFAVTITMAILVSGFVSLSLTPMLAGRFLRQGRDEAHGQGVARAESEGGFIFRPLVKGYEFLLHWVLEHRLTTILIAAALLAGTVHLYLITPKGFIPSEDQGMFIAYTMADEGISYDNMTQHMKAVSQIIASDPAVEGAMPIVGSGTMNNGIIFVLLKPSHERDVSPEQIIARLWPRVAVVPGIMTFMQNPPAIQVDTTGGKAAYQYTLVGTQAEDLYPAAGKFIAALRGLAQVRDVSSDMMISTPQVKLLIDRDKASTLGVDAQAIETALYSSFGGRQVTTINASADQYRVILELLPSFQNRPEDLEWLYVRSSQGNMVPLPVLAQTQLQLGPSQVNHYGQLPSVTVSFNTAPGVSLGEATNLVTKLAEQTLPPTVSGRFQGTAQEFQKSITSLMLLILMALGVIYLILGILYESFIHPVTILAGLPSAAFGALLTLVIFGQELNLYGFVGVIMLIGIVKKNAIMMIDFALEAERGQGLSPREAIFQGGVSRFRPIMMTTVAAFAGILPIALGIGAGGGSRQPLGLAVCGGLVVSQVITLLITPVIYTYFDEWSHRFGRKRKAGDEDEGEAQPVPTSG